MRRRACHLPCERFLEEPPARDKREPPGDNPGGSIWEWEKLTPY